MEADWVTGKRSPFAVTGTYREPAQWGGSGPMCDVTDGVPLRFTQAQSGWQIKASAEHVVLTRPLTQF